MIGPLSTALFLCARLAHTIHPFLHSNKCQILTLMTQVQRCIKSEVVSAFFRLCVCVGGSLCEVAGSDPWARINEEKTWRESAIGTR